MLPAINPTLSESLRLRTWTDQVEQLYDIRAMDNQHVNESQVAKLEESVKAFKGEREGVDGETQLAIDENLRYVNQRIRLLKERMLPITPEQTALNLCDNIRRLSERLSADPPYSETQLDRYFRQVKKLRLTGNKETLEILKKAEHKLQEAKVALDQIQHRDICPKKIQFHFYRDQPDKGENRKSLSAPTAAFFVLNMLTQTKPFLDLDALDEGRDCRISTLYLDIAMYQGKLIWDRLSFFQPLPPDKTEYDIQELIKDYRFKQLEQIHDPFDIYLSRGFKEAFELLALLKNPGHIGAVISGRNETHGLILTNDEQIVFFNSCGHFLSGRTDYPFAVIFETIDEAAVFFNSMFPVCREFELDQPFNTMKLTPLYLNVN